MSAFLPKTYVRTRSEIRIIAALIISKTRDTAMYRITKLEVYDSIVNSPWLTIIALQDRTIIPVVYFCG